MCETLRLQHRSHRSSLLIYLYLIRPIDIILDCSIGHTEAPYWYTLLDGYSLLIDLLISHMHMYIYIPGMSINRAIHWATVWYDTSRGRGCTGAMMLMWCWCDAATMLMWCIARGCPTRVRHTADTINSRSAVHPLLAISLVWGERLEFFFSVLPTTPFVRWLRGGRVSRCKSAY